MSRPAFGGQAKLTHFLDRQKSNSRGKRKHFDPQPWFVWKLEDKRQNGRFIVFEGQPIMTIPGVSSAVVHLFESTEKRLTSCAFSTGWRIDLKTANLTNEATIHSQVLVLRTEPVKPGRNVAYREVYAFVGSRLALIRLENAKGEILRNGYIYPNQTIGPPLPRRTPEQWERALNSDDLIEVLETLVWLGGRHLDPSGSMPSAVHEDVAVAGLFGAVWQRKGIQETLNLLVESKVKWVSEAAALAKTKDTRP